MWIRFHDAIEEQLGIEGELKDVRDVASKIADNAARLAALFHLFEAGPFGEIEADEINGACRIASWHLSESKRFFTQLVIPEEQSNAIHLDRWLINRCRKHGGLRIPRREVQQLVTPSRIRKKKMLEEALNILIEVDRAKMFETGKRKWIYVNPALLT